MGDVKLGSKNAEIWKIVHAIRKSTGYRKFYIQWTNLANSLETSPIDIETWKRSLGSNNTFDEVVQYVLEDFVLRKSKNATIKSLAKAFEDLDMSEIADMLRETFGGEAAHRSSGASLESSDQLPLVLDSTSVEVTCAMNSGRSQEDVTDGCWPKHSYSDDDNAPMIEYRQELQPVPPKEPMAFENDQYYRLPIKYKGLALILNIVIYKNNKCATRIGAYSDSLRMYNIWNSLGYEVQVEHRGKFTKDRVTKIIANFVAKCNTDKPKSVVVFLGGHGGHDELVMSNEKDKVHLYKDIVCKFNTNDCPGLKHIEGECPKPKIFLLSSCQEFLTDGSQFPLEHAIVGYSTSPGYVSYRDPTYGTYYAYYLTKALIADANKLDLETILKNVERTVKEATSGKQQPSYRYLGLKPLYFNMMPNK